jgi:3-hydroxyacyl-[acyl-carrier-protein] dehydratase
MIDKAGIEAIIPHRDPFLLLDRIVDLEAGVRAIGEKLVRSEEWYLAGHFPDRPVMPGVLIIEALAQTGAVALLASETEERRLPFFAGLDSVRFRYPVVPGDLIRLEVVITKRRKSFGKGEGRAYVGERLVAEAEMMFALVDS